MLDIASPRTLFVLFLATLGQARQYLVALPVPALYFEASTFVIAGIQLRNQRRTAEGRYANVVSQADEGIILMLMQWHMNALPQRSLKFLNIGQGARQRFGDGDRVSLAHPFR